MKLAVKGQAIGVIFLGLFAAGSHLPPAAFAQDGKGWATMFSRAEQQASDGLRRPAIRTYQQALRAATTAPQRAQTALALAGLMRTVGDTKQAAEYYQQALEDATGEQRILASNNYAALLIDTGEAARAVTQLRTTEDDASSIPNKYDRSRYHYTFGRALEKADQSVQALSQYRESLEFDPGSDVAASAALGLVTRIRGEHWMQESAALIDRAVDNNDLQLAERVLRASLAREGRGTTDSDAEIDAMFFAIVHYFTVGRIGPTAYSESWRPRLRDALGENRRGELRLADIDQIYSGEWPVPQEELYSESQQARKKYDLWRQPVADAPFNMFADFVKSVGDAYVNDEKPRALERYALAWLLEPNQGDTALYLAYLLLDARDEVDPEGRLLDLLVRELFEMKGLAYESGDRERIARLHVILGQIFERQREFGPPEAPASAIFQWERALRFQRELAGSDLQAAEKVPGLYGHLARSYLGIGDATTAWTNYLIAAEGYLRAGRTGAAKLIWTEANRAAGSPPSELQQRWNGINAAIP